MHKQSISLPSIAVATFVWIECVTEEMFRAVRNDIICLWRFWYFCFWTAKQKHTTLTFWSLSALHLELRSWPCGKDAALPGMEVSLLHTSLASLTKSFIARCPSRVAPCLQNLDCLLYCSTYCTLGSWHLTSISQAGLFQGAWAWRSWRSSHVISDSNVRLALEASAELPIFISFTTGNWAAKSLTVRNQVMKTWLVNSDRGTLWELMMFDWSLLWIWMNMVYEYIYIYYIYIYIYIYILSLCMWCFVAAKTDKVLCHMEIFRAEVPTLPTAYPTKMMALSGARVVAG